MIYYALNLRGEKTSESGEQKKVLERFLIVAQSVVEAVAKATEQEVPYFTEGYADVEKVEKISSIEEINDHKEGNFIYDVSLAFISLDEKSGKEKSATHRLLISESEYSKTEKKIIELMKDSVMNYKIIGIRETKFIDIIY